jgi:hypothetical protein
LKHVKENIKHGGWSKWLESVGIHERQAQRLMRVATELGTKTTTSSDLALNALYEIATLPPDQRGQEHEVNGQSKKPEDMTVKELREVKRQLKEAEEQRELAERLTLSKFCRKILPSVYEILKTRFTDSVATKCQRRPAPG